MHKNLSKSLFLITIFGPIYYGPPYMEEYLVKKAESFVRNREISQLGDDGGDDDGGDDDDCDDDDGDDDDDDDDDDDHDHDDDVCLFSF